MKLSQPCFRLNRLFSTSKISIIGKLFSNVENQLIRQASCNTDKILISLRQLNDLKVAIPSTYFVDSISVCAQRDDVVRTEILLHLSRLNLRNRSELVAPLNDMVLVPNPQERLVDFAIRNFMHSGFIDSGIKIWLTMGRTSFFTGKNSLELLVEFIHKRTTPPSLELLSKLERSLIANLWSRY